MTVRDAIIDLVDSKNITILYQSYNRDSRYIKGLRLLDTFCIRVTWLQEICRWGSMSYEKFSCGIWDKFLV